MLFKINKFNIFNKIYLNKVYLNKINLILNKIILIFKNKINKKNM